jgi:tetratricopeptide (TPR) repeat protein
MRKILVLGSVVIALALAFVLRNSRHTPTEPETARQEVQDDVRAATVAFWQHYRGAMKARREGQWEAAVARFAQALAINPEHEDSLYYLGNAYFEADEYEKAAESWRRLLEVNPMASRAHVQLAQLRSCPDVEGMFDLWAARSALERAIALNPEESGPLSRLGEVELALENRVRAAELFADARRTNPRAASALYLGAYLAVKNADRATAATLLSEAQSAVAVSRVTDLPALEGDIRPGDEENRVGETMSSRRLFAPLLQRLREQESMDADLEASAVDDYLRGLPKAGGS